jgi:hypothetical protein
MPVVVGNRARLRLMRTRAAPAVPGPPSRLRRDPAGGVRYRSGRTRPHLPGPKSDTPATDPSAGRSPSPCLHHGLTSPGRRPTAPLTEGRAVLRPQTATPAESRLLPHRKLTCSRPTANARTTPRPGPMAAPRHIHRPWTDTHAPQRRRTPAPPAEGDGSRRARCAAVSTAGPRVLGPRRPGPSGVGRSGRGH